MLQSDVRVVFMGTPDFSVPSLSKLVSSGHDIPLVITQPDRPKGRGGQPAAPAVKAAAQQFGLPLLQPTRLREPEILEAIRRDAPDVIVVAAFGQILPTAVLAIPRRGCLNVHASLLPRHRGAAPIAAAILAGDNETGVTIMLMEPGLDTGPILSQRREPIRPDDTTDSLTARLADVGADLLLETLPLWAAGAIQPQIQDDSLASYAPQLRREQGLIDWAQPAELIARKCRAFHSWPGCYTNWQGQNLKILAAEAAPGRRSKPGEVAAAVDGTALVIGTGQGTLVARRLQIQGKKPGSAADFLRGHRSIVGSILPSRAVPPNAQAR